MNKLILAKAIFLFCLSVSAQQETESLNNAKFDGYKGIWYSLGQFYEHGDKYSGGLGTYTAKHRPMAIYASEVDKTFFVYGGTTKEDEKHLLCMIGFYDHQKNVVSKPVVVHDKVTVNDPHDNPSLLIDQEGYLWVFVSGRAQIRPGFKYKSAEPYNINRFEQIRKEEMTYPQPWLMEDNSFFNFFTKYTGRRELYFETSPDGYSWSDDQKLAGMKRADDKNAGHYQVSAVQNSKLGTFFSWHPNGNVDKRTNLYYLQTTDKGETWTSANGNRLDIPLKQPSNQAMVINYFEKQRNVYLKDMTFDDKGHPMCIYITSKGHKPGPPSEPYVWKFTKWDGKQWETSEICESSHNYDMGSLYLTDTALMVIAPVIRGPQEYGVGGEIAIIISRDGGNSWRRHMQVTRNSKNNHSYVRRPLYAKDPFLYFWADGNPNDFSKSMLYFGNSRGEVWQLPYEMEKSYVTPVRMD